MQAWNGITSTQIVKFNVEGPGQIGEKSIFRTKQNKNTRKLMDQSLPGLLCLTKEHTVIENLRFSELGLGRRLSMILPIYFSFSIC